MNLIAFIMSIMLSWENVEEKYQTIVEADIFKILEFTIEDIELMARVTMSEASTEPYECKQAVVQTLLNRYHSDKYPDTIVEIIDGQYSTKNNGEPTKECYDAVLWGITHPAIFPTDMYWFRNKHYHTFAHPYTQIGKTYFSTATNYLEGEE